MKNNSADSSRDKNGSAPTGTPVEAVFTGTDSLGYRSGQTYRILIAATGGAVVIRRTDGRGMCPYQSWAAFGRNWRLLSPRP